MGCAGKGVENAQSSYSCIKLYWIGMHEYMKATHRHLTYSEIEQGTESRRQPGIILGEMNNEKV